MTKRERRRIAISAARGHLKRLGIDPTTASAESALNTLDEMYQVSPELIASIWYGQAGDAQLKEFEKEWREWQLRGYQSYR